MFLLLCVCACALLLGSGEAEQQASLWRGNDQEGRCHYTFSVPSPTDASCPRAGAPEVEGLKARLGLLEALVSRLAGGGEGGGGGGGGRGGGGGGGGGTLGGAARLQDALNQAVVERNLLRGEKARLEREVEALHRRLEEMRNRPCPAPGSTLQDGGLVRPGTGSSSMSHLVARPNSQGDTSSFRDPAWGYSSPGFQELKAEVTEVPGPEDSAGCGELVSVGEPITHKRTDTIAGKYGVWMQDPESVSPYGANTVWRIDTVGTEVRQLFGYDDMDQLSKGFPSKVLLLPEAVESTGATMYRGSLYFQRRRSRTIIRYDLASESVAARRDLPHAGFHGQFPYSWGGYTDIDLAVDEQGLWAVYSTSKTKGAIVISQLNPHNLEVKKSWETSIRKNSVANTFMICGRLYTVASYSAPNTTVNFLYDTETGQSKTVAIPFKNKYRYNSMIDYNPAQRKLFAWDNFHLVSYDVRLGRTPQAH